MEITVSQTKEAFVIRLVGSFDHTTHKQFRSVTGPAIANKQYSELMIDMAGVDRLDSSTLGLLLVTRDEAKRAGKTVSLKGAQGVARKVMDMSQFELLFTYK